MTTVNKESNLGLGKVWTNRLKKIIIPKVLPKTQFNCQPDINITDELREIRDVNNYLLGEGINKQVDGTILSIDFKDAFRSVSHRWFNLVMKQLGVPQEFIDWFWMMYRDLYVVIVLNRYKSDKICVKRGFMEGHPPSMGAFVISMIPLMYACEEKMTGIVTPSNRNHRIKLFADDLKLFIKNMSEVTNLYKVISNFEKVSGLEMHRDPARKKCQALPFGLHRVHIEWPKWITVQSTMKVVGGVFSNVEPLEKVNSDLVSKCFFDALHKSYGVKGTIFQKAYFVNTYLFSKLWFTAQFIKLDDKMLLKLLSKALDFIYAGENEKPIRPLNFRSIIHGGIGLIHPVVKSRALLIKHMNRSLRLLNGSIYDADTIENIYGYKEDFIRIIEKGLSTSPVKAIYDFMIQDITHRNLSLIPSRNEKRSVNVKWGVVFNNFQLFAGLSSEEKCFAWKVSQDMLAVGSRIHRKNAERRCLAILANGNLCQEIQNLGHLFQSCPNVVESYEVIILVLNNYLKRQVNFNDLIHFSINHRNKPKLTCALWFSVKMMFKIFNNKSINKVQLLADLIKELDWNLNLNRKIGSPSEMLMLKHY